ncbi:TonB-dependent receptor [bacterium 336/3]|nr:TonB-dependent receptor [bacterium 336/3]
MRVFTFLTIFFLFTSLSYGQIIQVKDFVTGKSIEGVSISSPTSSVHLFTDNQGRVNISALKDVEKIYFMFDNYQTSIFSYQQLKDLNFQVFLKPANPYIEEVVVSATRWQQGSAETPSQIVKISQKHIALQNPQTAADLLGISDKVFIQKSQLGGGSPMIRGFATNRLLYSVDGVRMNTAIFRAGNLQNVISLDPFAIENTEVLLGTGSVIYGSDAIGGIMNFTTLTPQFAVSQPLIKANSLVRYSSANQEKTTHFDVQAGWKKWAFATSVSRFDFGDLRMGSYGPKEYLRNFYVKQINGRDSVFVNDNPLIQRPTGYTQTNLTQKIRFKASKNWLLEYGYHYSQTSEYARYDRLIELSNGLPRVAIWNYGPQKWRMHLLNVLHEKQTLLYDQVQLRLAYQYFEESRIDRNFSGSQRFRLRTQQEQVYAVSTNLDFRKKMNQHQFFYGLEYVQNNVFSNASALDIRNQQPIGVPNRYPRSFWASYAGYVNYQYNFSDRFLGQAGIRYNALSLDSDFSQQLNFYDFNFTKVKTKNASTTFSLGTVFQPYASWKIGTNLATGFRAPNVDDMGKLFDFGVGEVIVPNTQLKPEYAYNADINISKNMNDKLIINVAGFYTYLDKAMVRRSSQVNGQDSILYNGTLSKVYSIQNAASASVYGVNLDILIKFLPSWSVYSSYNYQKGLEEMDNGSVSPLRHASPAFGVTRLSFEQKRLTLQAYAMYNAQIEAKSLNDEEKLKTAIYAIDSNGKPYSPSWYTLNLKAMYKFDNFNLNIGLENITDQRYRPYSSGIVAAGRNFIISFSSHF